MNSANDHLFSAVSRCDPVAASISLANGADILQLSSAGESVWPAAVSAGSKAVEFAISLGADPNTLDVLGRNSLFWAVQADDPDIAAVLIKNGGHVVSADGTWSAIHDAIIARHERVLESIIRHVPNQVLEFRDNLDRNALELAESVAAVVSVKLLRAELMRRGLLRP